MSTPRYVATKVGDRYEMVRKDSGACVECVGMSAVGAVMAVAGLRRGGLLGKLATLGGGCALYRAATGRSPLQRLGRWLRGGPAGDANLSPSYQNDYRRHSDQMPEDEVEEASMESFPASDPPAHARPRSPTPAPGQSMQRT